MIGAAILHSARQNVVLLSKTLFYSAEHCSVRQNDFREPEVIFVLLGRTALFPAECCSTRQNGILSCWTILATWRCQSIFIGDIYDWRSLVLPGRTVFARQNAVLPVLPGRMIFVTWRCQSIYKGDIYDWRSFVMPGRSAFCPAEQFLRSGGARQNAVLLGRTLFYLVERCSTW